MARFTADTLQTQYGEELARPPLSDAKTPRMLMKAFLERIPPVVTTDGISQFYLLGITHIVRCIRKDLPHRMVFIECRA